MDEAMDSRLQKFITDSNDALEFKLVRKVQDLEDERTTFKPAMSHQVFGDNEAIFGYTDLKIKLYYAAGCLETYLGMTYSSKASAKIADVEPDDVLPKISEVLSREGVHNNIDSFVQSLSKDEKFVPEGEAIYKCSVDDEGLKRHFEVYKASMSSKKFKEYHQRLQTFVLWYVDAANFIDIDDENWHYFNMFEKYKADDGSDRYATIGFATVYQYYAYPTHTRPRISQVLILPPFQKIGLGTHLIKAIYQEYANCNTVKDITVEDPSQEFQRLRDYVDCLNCSNLACFSEDNLKLGFNQSMATEAREKFKINKNQARRVYEILRLKSTDSSNEDDYRDYRLNVKKRLNIPYRKKENEVKKLEAALKKTNPQTSNMPLPLQEERIKILEKEYNELEEEYITVIKRLENTGDQ